MADERLKLKQTYTKVVETTGDWMDLPAEVRVALESNLRLGKGARLVVPDKDDPFVEYEYLVPEYERWFEDFLEEQKRARTFPSQ